MPDAFQFHRPPLHPAVEQVVGDFTSTTLLATDSPAGEPFVAATARLQAQLAADLAWAQQHVVILSGLYGALRPFDRLQPYRLEMGTRLANAHGADLYAFWGRTVSDHLNQRLAEEAPRKPLVVNLASQEYFRAVDRRALKARVIDCVFEDWKGGNYKIISFFAKRARGLMARYAITHRLATPHQLEGFDLDGYAFAPASSTPERLVFRRKAPPAL